MEETKDQKEFFEFEKPKRRFPGLRQRIFGKDNNAITLTVESLVFISIGFVMLSVIIYALGVERGKSLSRPAPSITSRVPEKAPPASAAKPLVQKAIEPVGPTPAVSTAPIEVKPASQGGRTRENPYTIVAVTFTRRDTAQQEAERLKRAIFDAFVMQSDSYYLVCVGGYPDKNSSQSKKALAKIRQIYKDAYFRLR